MNIRENGGFTVAGDRALLTLPLGDTYHGILVYGDEAGGMDLADIGRAVLYLNDRIIWDVDPRRFLIMDEHRAGNAAAYPQVLCFDFTEPDAKDPVSEFLGSIGTRAIKTFTADALAMFANDMCGIDVESLKLELYAKDGTTPALQKLRSSRRVSPGTPLSRHILTILPQKHKIGGEGKWEIQLPKGPNCAHKFKRHWLFERLVTVGGVPTPPKAIEKARVVKNDRIVYEASRANNEYDLRRYKGVPNDEVFILDYCMYNYSATEALIPQDASDLYIQIETTADTVVDLFAEAYTDFTKSGI